MFFNVQEEVADMGAPDVSGVLEVAERMNARGSMVCSEASEDAQKIVQQTIDECLNSQLVVPCVYVKL